MGKFSINSSNDSIAKSIHFRYFVDIRLYNKARSAIEPFAFSRFREEKIRQQVEASRPARLKIKSNLPAVNQELALKFIDENENRKKTGNLLKDDRFKALFNNPDFEVDKNADEYKMLTPVLSRLERGKVKELKKKVETTQLALEAENEAAKSSDDDLFSEKGEDEEMQSSDDDDRGWEKDLKRNYRQIRKEQKRSKGSDEDDESDNEDVPIQNGNTNKNHSESAPQLEFKVKNITDRLSRYVYF